MINDPIAAKKALIEERKRQAAAAKGELLVQPKKEEKKFIPPADAINKIRIIADNSGSMGSYADYSSTNKFTEENRKLNQAKKGIIEFLRNCVPNKDAVAIHMLNKYTRNTYQEEYMEDESSTISDLINNSTLCTDLVLLASAVDNDAIKPIGGTPLFEVIARVLITEPKATRIVAFSDGAPDSSDTINYEIDAIKSAQEKKIPIDTVFFGSALDKGAEVMKDIAEKTGGIYISFDPAKGVSFATAFKYLSPGKRLMLMNAEFKAKLERGEIK